ncbi:MAG TPA: hypothetical protein PLC08_02480 [Candidatus Bipolaricaulis sp.]|nr:hypothetical protein [Candidatus Bipolaricaulis sp.]HPD06728.1 hypothetical protein [Candidatus Bipolaricaulis sp.]HRS13481.1 hypothetical protein [Candidatus Bipolaricaulis sp.]HRU22089.1 hypothetical protein [Candidatus Bipolaricaulis sp.]
MSRQGLGALVHPFRAIGLSPRDLQSVLISTIGFSLVAGGSRRLAVVLDTVGG